MSFGMIILTPTSRTFLPNFNYASRTFDNRKSGGSITLQSNNPWDPPLIDPGLLVTDFDLFAARESIKKAYRFVEAPVWKDYIIAPTIDLLNMTTDALDEFIRNTGSSSGHIVSTAAMSAKDASYGVASISLLWICPKSSPVLCPHVVQVNPDLLVKGASGLSIIDASIMVGEKSLFPVPIKTDHIEAFHS
jgi:choline dehydrogenase-like flavoprotein